MMITLDEFEAGFCDVWRSVQNDFTHKLIDYEADLQAFVITKDELRGWTRALEWVLGKVGVDTSGR